MDMGFAEDAWEKLERSSPQYQETIDPSFLDATGKKLLTILTAAQQTNIEDRTDHEDFGD